MSIVSRRIEEFAKLIANLADKPNATYSATQLKQYFDGSPEELRQKHNGLIDDLQSTTDSSSGADNIGVTSITGISGNTVQSVLEGLKAYIDSKTS